MAGKDNLVVGVRLDSERLGRIEEWMEESGETSRAAAVRHFMDEGMRRADDGDAAISAVEAAAERLEEAAAEIERMRRTEAKASRAAFASASMLAWLSRDFASVTAAQLSKASSESAAGERLRYWATATPAEIFRFHLNAGGAMLGDPKTDFFQAFEKTRRKAPWRDVDEERLFGMDEAAWDEATGRANDAAAIRFTAGGDDA